MEIQANNTMDIFEFCCIKMQQYFLAHPNRFNSSKFMHTMLTTYPHCPSICNETKICFEVLISIPNKN
jgi:hypothetical protein